MEMTRKPTPAEVAFFVAESIDQSVEHMLGNTRDPGCCEGRWACLSMYSEMAETSVHRAAEAFGIDRSIRSYFLNRARPERKELFRRIVRRARARLLEHMERHPEPVGKCSDVRATPGPPPVVENVLKHTGTIRAAVAEAVGVDDYGVFTVNPVGGPHSHAHARHAAGMVAMSDFGMSRVKAAKVAGFQKHNTLTKTPQDAAEIERIANKARRIIAHTTETTK